MAHLQGRPMLVLTVVLIMVVGFGILDSVPASQAAVTSFLGEPRRGLRGASAGHLEVAGPGLAADDPLASLEIAKTAGPHLVRDGAQVTYTLRVTNTGSVSLTATITDVLPAAVMPTGSLRWTALISPTSVWTHTLPVTVTDGYTGSLTNLMEVTTEEGAGAKASVTTCANACLAHLPLVLRVHSNGLPPREWDPRLDDLGVELVPAPVEPGQSYWRLVEARWADPIEGAERINIFFEVLDENGERAAGQPVVVDWPEGSVILYIKPGPPPEWGADFPMFNTLGSYNAEVGGELPSDRVEGMGLGTAEEPDVKHHTSFYLTFRLVP